MNGNRVLGTLTDLRGDRLNIAFLLLLYVLQGIPLGVTSAVPLLLQKRKVSYTDQALFSFVSWPFSLKLLWAPIVDSLFWRWMGRRKSWLVPVQLGIGAFMLMLSRSVSDILPDDPASTERPNIELLTLIFLLLNFFCATQDIVVDGWALTMLKRSNIGYASTCNTVGQTAGYFIGNIVFIALESANFSNKYIRSKENQSSKGIVTFESFLLYNGIVYLIVTVLVAIFRREKNDNGNVLDEVNSDVAIRLQRRGTETVNLAEDVDQTMSNHDSDETSVTDRNTNLTVKETYAMLYEIMKLPSFQLLALILLTNKIGFSASEGVSGLKLIDAGVPQESLAMLAVPMVPLQILLPWFISRYTCGPRPLDIFIKAYPYRLMFGLIFPLVYYLTPSMKLSDGTLPYHYYFMLFVVYGLHQIPAYCMFVSGMAFHAAVSDPKIGGTYMTLLNTISNLGSIWPSTLVLYLVEPLTIQSCQNECKPPSVPTINQTIPMNSSSISSTTISSILSNNSVPATNSSSLDLVCKDVCNIGFDGYYTECIISVLIGFIWLYWGARKMRYLQQMPPVAWSVTPHNKRRS